MADILNKTQFSNPVPGKQLESVLYIGDIELLRKAINLTYSGLKEGQLKAVKGTFANHAELQAFDIDTAEIGDRYMVIDDSDTGGTGKEYVTYAVADVNPDPILETNGWVVDSVGSPIASDTNDGLLTKEDFVKLRDLNTGAEYIEAVGKLEGDIFGNTFDIKSNTDSIATIQNTISGIQSTKQDVNLSGSVYFPDGTNTVVGRMEDAGQRLVSLETKATDSTTGITALEGRVSTVEGKVTTIEGNITDINQKVTDNKAEADDTKARMDKVEPLANAADTLSKANAGKLATNTSAIAANTTGVATNKGDIATNTGNIAANTTKTDTNATELIDVKAINTVQDGRLEVLEESLAIGDKEWKGSIPGAASVDLSGIKDEDGLGFTFDAGKKLEVVIEKISASLEQAHDLITGATNATPYVIGQRAFTAKLDAAGMLTLTTTGNDFTDFNVVRVIEARGSSVAATGFTKNEATAQFAQKAVVAAMDGVVKSNTAAIGVNATAASANATAIAGNTSTLTTQETEISGLSTKVGTNTSGIATNKGLIDANKVTADRADGASKSNAGVIDQLGDKDMSDGTKLLDTAATIATEKDMTDADTVVLNAAKADATSKDTALEAKITAAYQAVIDSELFMEKGEHKDFISAPTNTKYNDATLFDKVTYTDGQAKIGGTDKSVSKGSIPASTAIQAGHAHKVTGAYRENFGFDSGSNTRPVVQEQNNIPQLSTDTQAPKITITQAVAHNTTGTVDPKGVKILGYTFIAKKDITKGEMK